MEELLLKILEQAENSFTQTHEKKPDQNENSENESQPDTALTIEYDWHTIKAEYLTGRGPKYLAEKYKIPVDTIKSRIKREGWIAEKDKMSELVQLKARDQYAESLTEKQVESREDYRKIYSKVRERLTTILERCTDVKDMGALMKILSDCQRGEFKCLGITDNSDEKLHFAINPQPEEISKRENILKSAVDELTDKQLIKAWGQSKKL